MGIELPIGMKFLPMQIDDVRDALQIIFDHDEDDGEEAAVTYRQDLEGQYVLKENDRIVGITGAKSIEGTYHSYGISWTYLERESRHRGYGRLMLESLLNIIESEGGRRVFVNTSDYVDPDEGDIYRDAREAYQAVGFIEELRHNDFYDEGEAQITYGKRLRDRAEIDELPEDDIPIRLLSIDVIPECEGAYWVAWEPDDLGSSPAAAEQLAGQAREQGGRVLFMSVPSHFTSVPELMRTGGFKNAGQLLDYYEDGIHEVHYRLDL